MRVPEDTAAVLDRPHRSDPGSPDHGDGTLMPMEAAVLIYLQAGHTTVSRISLSLGTWSTTVREALRGLAARGYAVQVSGQAWQATEMGEALRVTQPDPDHLPLIGHGRRKRPRPSTATRMLEHLDRPRYGPELARSLGVTRQQVRNIVERLHAEGSVKVADPDQPTFVIARSDDPTILLTRSEERVLSALPQRGYVTAKGIAGVCKKYANDVERALGRLRRYGLAVSTNRRWRRKLTATYQLTDAGRQHPQRRDDLRQAKPITPYASKRVYQVLRYIADNGPTKAKHVAEALDTPRQSTNALFQYLKRQQLVFCEGQKQHHGYRLTDHGRSILNELDMFWAPTGIAQK